MGWHMPGYCTCPLSSKSIAPCWVLKPQYGYFRSMTNGQTERKKEDSFVSAVYYQGGVKAAQRPFPHKANSTGKVY